MVCLFCSLRGHESNRCHKYKTDEERKSRPNSNRFCFSCRVESDVAHLPEDKKCKTNENCNGWFSTEHHQVFCFERIKALGSKLFLPKIDQNLMQRFLETLDIEEKYSVAFSSPSVADFIPLKPIKITYIVNFERSNMDVDEDLYDSIKSKAEICLTRTLRIDNSKLSAEMVLQLLSPYTKKFLMHRSSFKSKLSFTDIIKKAPNLENFYAYDSSKNVVYEKTWIKDLLKYKTGRNFTNLMVKLDTVELDVENLVKFIKTKCDTEEARIKILFTDGILRDDKNSQIFAGIVRKLSKFFKEWEGEEAYLKIGNDRDDKEEAFSLENFEEPPKEIMPRRAAKKRKHSK